MDSTKAKYLRNKVNVRGGGVKNRIASIVHILTETFLNFFRNIVYSGKRSNKEIFNPKTVFLQILRTIKFMFARKY